MVGYGGNGWIDENGGNEEECEGIRMNPENGGHLRKCEEKLRIRWRFSQLAPLSEILGREMETIGSGETRNTIKTIPSKITFLSQNDFRTKANVS